MGSSSPPLNMICLISGGKDSFLSLLHCLSHGHNVVALANLHPPHSPTPQSVTISHGDGEADLNSHMYQTAGHALIPLYAKVLSIPLYRAPISGSAVNLSLDYQAADTITSSTPDHGFKGEEKGEDETESLLPLLRRILAAHPEANAVSSGAIQSTYQRTRIESVCSRLGLIPIAYLWQYVRLPRSLGVPGTERGLLEDVAGVGLDARIVKVASGGLDESFLWENLGSEAVRRRIGRAVERFGGSAVGEGGEFESLVIAGPRPIWKGRVVINDSERIIGRGEGGEAWLGFKGGQVDIFPETKAEEWESKLQKPYLWDGSFYEVGKEIYFNPPQSSSEPQEPWSPKEWTPRISVLRTSSTITISNLTGTGSTIADQMASVSILVQDMLSEWGLGTSDIISTTILLRSMSSFASINEIYGSWFTSPNPPARVTVSCGSALPLGTEIILSFTASFLPREQRKGLHVQSRSYWAPANIGPYSQAIRVPLSPSSETSVTYIAGQIPLVPSTMEVLSQPTKDSKLFIQQTALSLQHLWRIGIEMGVSFWTGGIAFIVSSSAEDSKWKAKVACEIWDRLHQPPSISSSSADEEEGPDEWDKRFGGQGSLAKPSETPTLPNFDSVVQTYIRECEESHTPGFFAVQVEETPRNCAIEWQSLGISGGNIKLSLGSDRISLWNDAVSVEFIAIPNVSAEVLDKALATDGGKLVALTIYTPFPQQFGADDRAQIVPCFRVWGSGGTELGAGVVVRKEVRSGLAK